MEGLSIYIFITLISLFLIIFGYITREEYGGYYAAISGFVLIFITGLVMFSNPLTIPIGNEGNITYSYSTVEGYPVVNGTSINIDTVYSSESLVISNTIAFVFLLLGIFGIILTSIIMFNVNLKHEEELE